MADAPPIVAQSADGMLHQFPAGTDASVIDGAMRTYVEQSAPAPPTEAPSGTLKGMAKAAGQGVAEIPGNIVKGVGAGTVAVGAGMGAVEKADRDLVRDRLDIMDRIDKGEEVKPQPVRGMAAPMFDPALQFANQYAGADADERKAIRQRTMNDVAAPEPSTADRIATSTKKVGAQVFGAGHAMGEAVDKAIPLTKEEQSRPTVQFTKALTGLVGYVGAGALGGMAGVIGYAGIDAMGQTFEDAKAKGATDEDAAAASVFSGLVQGGMMTVPVGQALKVMEKLPAAFKGQFIHTVLEMAKSGATLTAFSQLSSLADNVVAKNTYDPERKLTQGIGEHLGPTFAAGAVLPVLAVGAQRVAQRFSRKVSPADAKPVMDAPDVDSAIDAANRMVETKPIDVPAEVAGLREFGGPEGEHQAALLDLFGGLNAGTIERAQDGGYHYQIEQGAIPLRVWEPGAAAQGPTLSPLLVKAQRDHYRQLGIDVVYFANDLRIPFDGAVDPQNPNTLFLSSDPSRNAAQVGAHEVTHILERTTLPDGTNLGDILQRQIAQGVTPEGMAHAQDRFSATAPDRTQFGEGPEGDSAHADAVTAHLIRELGADIGGEAPKFHSFLPRVVDAVQARYGTNVARDVMQKLIDGIRDVMRTLREMFSRPEEMAEYGQTETVSQRWVTNLDAIHGTLAQMYAERFGSPLPQLETKAAAPRARRAVEAPPPEVAAAPAVEVAPRPVEATAEPAVAPEPAPPPAAPPAPVEPTQLQKEQEAVRAMKERKVPAAEPAAEPSLSEHPGEVLAGNRMPPSGPRVIVNRLTREQMEADAERAQPSREARPEPAPEPAPERKVLFDVESASSRRTPPLESHNGPFKGFASTDDRGRLAVDAYGNTAAEARKNAVDRLDAEFQERERRRAAEPAPEARPEPKPEAPDAREAQPDHQMADEVNRMIADAYTGGVTGRLKISGGDLQRVADRIYGGTLAEGKYTRDRLYDAIELGVNRFIQKHPDLFDPTVNGAPRAQAIAKDLARLKDMLPTQTVRAGEKDTYQQFSTPPDYAYAANWVANLKPTDHVVEPSAGVGGLIVHAMNAGVRETTVNELSDKRRGMIAALEPTRIHAEDAAQLHNILPGEVRPTVVVMNPPFSRSAERMGNKLVLDEGAKHIEQALSRLEPGGRLVAIVGDSMKPEGTAPTGTGREGTGRAFRGWWSKIGAVYDVRANVGVDRGIYSKYGTSFPTRLLVIDKNAPSGRPMVTGQARDAADLIDRLQEVRNDRSTLEPLADQPGGTRLAERGEGEPAAGSELRGPAGGVGAGEERGRGAAPDVTEPAGAPQPGIGGGRTARSGGARRGARERVVPVEPEPVARGAGGEPGAPAQRGEEPERGGAGGGGDGLRPDGSGERVEPGVTPAPEDVVATENAVAPEAADHSEGLSEAIYENYRPQRIQIVGAKAHPGALVQSAAMASVLPPDAAYKPRLPAALIKGGALSDAQLEAIVYAGQAHSDVMPNGKRRGFFIGDGTGVGKGREIAGILLDNKQNGRTKAVWVSEKRALLNDAKRDWNGLGQPASDILDHGKTKAGEDIGAKSGILFTTYDTLKSAEQTKSEGEKVRGRERLDQIVDWLGKDFDGVIAFDESHNLGNAIDTKGGRGVKKAAQKALAGIALQDKLPNARVVYVSATGATEVGNLAYADRLGLWGEGTAFANRQDFIGKVSEGGMAAMELVARDMKALGHYIARSLSYDGVSYDRVEHVLSADQRVTYDKLAEGWQHVLQNFNAALEMTGAVSENGKALNGRAKAAAMSAFWGGHQRFFNQIITSMQMPSVIRGVEADIKAKRQAVLQLVNTMEAAQERALEKARKSGEGELEDLDMTPRDQLMQLVEKSFPVQQMENYIDDNGNQRSRAVQDKAGNPVLNREAVAARDRLLDQLGSLRVPDGPLEMLLNHFGPDKVAEVTGRGQRVVKKPDDTGRMVTAVEKRGAQANVTDANAFQEGKKPILVFSEAGGTGRSYHAAIGSGSEDARRSHYLVQGGWRADKAVQGFGRTHRTSQASAPIFHLVTTDLQGQKRFISSIARRLGQLGALTRGERRTGDQGMFGMRDNLESTEARDGLTQFFRDVNAGSVEGVSMQDLEQGMGLKLRDENGALVSPLPEMSQFLNRVLSLTIDHQNRVFDAFSERMDQAIGRAAAAGTLDTGVETYKADKITKLSEQPVYTDPRSGAETMHVHLQVHTRNRPVGFRDTVAGKNKTNGAKPDTFIQNTRSERVFAVTRAGDKTDANGSITSQVRLTSPTDYQLVDRERIGGENWKKLTPKDAETLWDKQVAATPEYRNSDLHLITGAVLPIWDRLGGNPKIYRLQTAEGERMLGRVIPASQVDATLERLGAEGIKVTASPAEIAQRVLGGATAQLANEWTIKPSRVAGEQRLELVGPDYRHGGELERHGVFSERIQYKTRFFIPTEPAAAAAAIEAITKTRPVTSLSDQPEHAQFSPRLTGENPDRDYTPFKETFANVGRITEPLTLREKIDNARDDIGRKLIRETMDSYIGLKADDPEGYMAARLANSVAGAQEVFRLHGTLRFDGATYNYKDLNGGVRSLVKSLGAEAHDFLWWVAAHRAERLKEEDRENLFSNEDIETLKQLNRGEVETPRTLPGGKTTHSREAIYADALRKYDTLNKSVTDLVADSGLVKRGVVDSLWADPFYVPFFREAAAEGTTRFAAPTSGLVKQYASQRLKGGAEKLKNDLWDNAFGNWDHMIDAALRNRAAAHILDTASNPALGAAEKVNARQFEYMTKAERAETAWAMVDGEKQYYRVTDPMVFKAVSALETAGKPGPIMTVARWFSRALRYGVTANPLFAVRNLIRDTENSIAVSQISANPLRNLADGFSRIDTGDRLKNLARAMAGHELEDIKLEPETVSAMAGGALMRLGTASDAGVPKTDLRNILDTPGRIRAFGRYIAEVAGAYKETLAGGEEVNRLALYSQMREAGAPHDFAAFSARDLQDFTLRGASPFVRAITDITPFSGARLQGLYKLGRSAADADKSVAAAVGGRVARNMAIRAATVMGAMTLAGLALDAIYHDDEDYRKRTEYDRQTYFWFKIGSAQFRVPKGFELAALSSVAADGIEAFFDKEMTGSRVVNNFWLSLGTNLQIQAPAVVQPIIDIATNTRGTGGPIETMGMERLQPEQRYTQDSTLIARGASAAVNTALRVAAPNAGGPSPVQLDYLANAYGGWLATSVLGMADAVVRSASSAPTAPAKDFWAQATQGLVSTEPRGQSRYVDMLYSQGKQIEQAYSTYRDLIQRGQGEEAQRFFEANKETLQKHGLVSGVMRLEGELNKQIRMISNNPDSRVTAEMKRIQIQQLQALRSRAAEQAFGAH